MTIRIGGFGELESYRQALRKDVAKPSASRAGGVSEPLAPEASARAGGDAVQISSEARMRAKLAGLPDVRAEKVEAAKAKLAGGELLEPAVVERGARRMIESLLNGDL